MTQDAPTDDTTSLLTAEEAWRLVLALRSGYCPSGPPWHLDTDDGTRLTVAGDGSWQCAPAPSAAARDLLDIYLPLCANPSVNVFAQLGQSLDGRIAAANGTSHYVTGIEDRCHLHRLRALADAVVIGAGTACADDPALTVRHTTGTNPTRVVIDPNGRVPGDRQLFHDGAAPVLLLHADGAMHATPGVSRSVAVARGTDGELEPGKMLAALHQCGLRRILIEGGGLTVSRFLQAGLLDRLHVTVAPMIIGSGRPAFSLPVIDSLDDAWRPPCRRYALGADVLFDFALDTAR